MCEHHTNKNIALDPQVQGYPPGFPPDPSPGDDEMPPLMSPGAPARAEPTPAAAAPSMPSMAVGTPVRLKGLKGPKHLPGSSAWRYRGEELEAI